MFSRYLVLYLVLSTLVMEVQGGKTVLSTCFGKLVPAVIKCFGARIFGLNMNKVKHIMIARHYLDKLDPGEIVYEVITVVASNLPYKNMLILCLCQENNKNHCQNTGRWSWNWNWLCN